MKVLEGPIYSIPVDAKFIDVFTGKGWDNYSRFEHMGKYLKLVKGVGVSDEEYKELLRRYI